MTKLYSQPEQNMSLHDRVPYILLPPLLLQPDWATYWAWAGRTSHLLVFTHAIASPWSTFLFLCLATLFFFSFHLGYNHLQEFSSPIYSRSGVPKQHVLSYRWVRSTLCWNYLYIDMSSLLSHRLLEYKYYFFHCISLPFKRVPGIQCELSKYSLKL